MQTKFRGWKGLQKLLAVLAFMCAALPVAHSELITQSQNTLKLYDRVKLDLDANLLALSADGNLAYFVSNKVPSGGASLFVVGVPEFAPAEPISIEHHVDQIRVDPSNPNRLLLAGRLDERFVLTQVLVKEKVLGSYISLAGNGTPAILLGRAGGTYLGGSDSNVVVRLNPKEFLPLKEAQAAIKARKSEAGVMQIQDVAGIAALAATADEGVLFVSDSGRPQIVAVSLEKPGAVLARYGDISTGSVSRLPLLFEESSRASSRSKSGFSSSLTVANRDHDSLIVLDFNESINSFGVVSGTDISLNGLISKQQAGNGEALDIQLAASADQSVILLGDTQNSNIELLSRSGPTLQRLLPIELGDVALDIALAGKGTTALALLKDGSIAFLTTGEFEITRDRLDNPEFFGNETVREIQYRLDRLGFSVGAIDGNGGARTKFAVSEAILKFGLDSGLSLDEPEKLLEALNSLKSAN